LAGPGYARNQLDFGEVGQFQLRHHRVSIAQFDGDRQCVDGHALGRQGRRRAVNGAGEDEHAVARQGFGFYLGGYIHTHFQQRLGRLCDAATALLELLCRAINPALQGDTGIVLWRQLREKAVPVVDGFLITLALKGGDTQQAETGDFLGVELQGFVGQRLNLWRPLFVVGKVLRLGPLAEQFRLAPGQCNRTFKDFGSIGGTVLGHIGATEEVQTFCRIRLCSGGALQTAGHVGHGHRWLGKLSGQFNLVARAIMQVQRNAQHRHQKRRQKRQWFAQPRFKGFFHAFGVGQQLTGRFGAAGVELRDIQHAFVLLRLQLGDAFLVQRHVQRGAILFTLGTTATQHRDQQETQGNQ